MRVGPYRRLRIEELMLLNCGAGEDSWESLWTARRANQSILKEINPECSLEGLMLKLQHFGPWCKELTHRTRPWYWERSLVFPILFKWVYLSFSPLLFIFLFFTAICKASSDSHLLFCISFSWGWYWSLSAVQCHEPPSIVHQALCLSDLSLKSISHFHCIIIRDLT